jgi:hypothetical protein
MIALSVNVDSINNPVDRAMSPTTSNTKSTRELLAASVIDAANLTRPYENQYQLLGYRTVWHWRNLVEGRMIFNPNLLWGSRTLLRVAEIGSSIHFRLYVDAILSSLSLTQVLPMPVTVRCQEILESI